MLPNTNPGLTFVWIEVLVTEVKLLQSKAEASHCASLHFFPPSDRAQPTLYDSYHLVGHVAEELLLILLEEKGRGLKDSSGLLSLEAGCWQP